VQSVESQPASRCFLAQLIFSTLKMEAIYCSETSADTQRTTWRYIQEDGKGYNELFILDPTLCKNVRFLKTESSCTWVVYKVRITYDR
jgi:hypothetical protein